MKHFDNDRSRCSRDIRNPAKTTELESKLTFHNDSCGDSTHKRNFVHHQIA